MHSQLPRQLLATLGPSSNVERVLLHLTSATCGGVSLRPETKLWMKRVESLSDIFYRQIDHEENQCLIYVWGCKSKSTFSRGEKKSVLHRELLEIQSHSGAESGLPIQLARSHTKMEGPR